MDIQFGSWQPDRGETAAPMMVADGVLPVVDGYGPYPSLYTPTGSQALPAAPRGVFSLVLNDGTWKAYLFTGAAFYDLQSDFSLSLVDNGYACPSGYDWSAIHFGNTLLYTNTFDGLHSYNVELGGATSYISAAGDPGWILTCANFIVALNCKDSLGNRDNRLIKTSGFNDQTNWVTDGADYQELADGEALICGFDLKQNTALLLQLSALTLMTFGNAPGGAQFSLQKVADGKGTVGANSCVSFDGLVFGLATDDFFMFSLGTGYVSIGADEIARTFLASVDQTNYPLVQGAVDPLRKVVLWRYKRSLDSSLTVSEVIIGYEWRLKKWFTLTEQTSYLARLATVGVTYNAITGTYDSQTLTYDDRFWAGNAPLSGALDENYKFSVFTGPSLGATMTTGVTNSPVSGKILWATPITDAAVPSLNLGVKDDLTDLISWQGAATKTEGGRVPFEGRGLNAQFSLTIPAGDDWTYARGIDHIKGASGGPK